MSRATSNQQYAGSRTEGTRNISTKVRRIISFAQIFFFTLSYMSSWEAIASHAAVLLLEAEPKLIVDSNIAYFF
ncbi:hypothetical protein LTS03_005380 [Exophiala xenobiotica]|nr:hypothetical protein LTR41_005771 [Exophiala xenobiotica]KAK5253653.1 hypothetical protein LTS06_002085 [Exophiala xenobiotica]KAK5258593.1 hypothetical protein LTR40_007594 [Exophiala xenobiotica]KAK5319041.1 hypothetical protein LTR93_007736 [Exophiala xenobiotica]KAK5349475.1 hypothetical protein LTR61_006865 [Exophiala xenobiotica]